MIAIHPQFITDSEGNKLSAILPIDEFQSILEELEDLEDIRLYDASKSDKEPAIAKEEAMKIIEDERKKQGL
ncbi:MAG: hypothetical protein RL660_2490 [Bacteroidota bacterium]|jgi:hypothetical protein